MISIIICSKYNKIDSVLERNIKETVGVDHEIVHIDNSECKYNIFQAYNIGVEKAKGEYLCFMHEDILFHTHNWGQIVENYLQNDYVGAIGVAGGCHVAKEMDWRFYGYGHVNLIQGTCTIEPTPHYYRMYVPPCYQERSLKNVAVLDGVWICIRKKLFEHIRFDDKTFSDFHLYDSDICMQVNQLGKGVFVCFDVLLEHFSVGTFTPSFKHNLELFFKKWGDCLPMTKGIMVDAEEVQVKMNEAHKKFDKRLEYDAIVVGLRQKIKEHTKTELTSRHFCSKELDFMDASLFQCCRVMIKDKNYKKSEAWAVVSDYRKSFFSKRRNAIFAKYIWYRYIKK